IMRRSRAIIFVSLLCAMTMAAPSWAQLRSPLGQVALPRVGGAVGGLVDEAGDTLDRAGSLVERQARDLLRLRDQQLARLLRQNRDKIERDATGSLARRGVLLSVGISPDDLNSLNRAGFAVIAQETIEGLDLQITRLSVPVGMDLAKAQSLAAKIAPRADISADNLHWQSESWGAGKGAVVLPGLLAAQARITFEVPIGIIDGAPGPAFQVTGRKGFPTGALLPSDHGSAVASLLRGEGASRLWVADVYGSDPAGGNALAIVQGLGWLVNNGCKVITISLVGPRNTVLERAIRRAQQRGVLVVAAVGNDGPASPPAFPASYDGVVAVTGVDRKGRALIEAGRALHLDYAAPGADVYALNARGKSVKLRGTSFATPLAAIRVAAAMANGGKWQTRLDAQARDLGPKGPDKRYGRGLLCEGCGKKK
ncbi:MAG: S8 family serine peptidase, partial [Blastomonas fulva]